MDVLVKKNVWEKLSAKYPNNINGDYIDIDCLSFTHTDKDFLGDMDTALKNSDIIDGFHVLTLAQTKKWKEKVGSEKHLKDAKVIEESTSDKSVKLGTTVTLFDFSENEEVTYTLVGSVEANPLKGLISNECALGEAIFGKKVDDVVLVKAVVPYEVKILAIK